MATFISLITMTQAGEEHIDKTVDRAKAFAAAAKKAGAKVKSVYWTLGAYDGVLVFEAPDDETAAALTLGLGAKGTVRTQTLRAFNDQEMKSILSQLS